MAEKLISKGREAREYLLKGLEIAAETVGATAGPKGRNVAIQTPVMTRARLTKDGVTVAKSLELDGFENEGLKLAKTAASISAEKSGDGTTATTILTYAIAKEGLQDVSAGANPQDLKRGIELGVKHAVEYIKSKAKPIDSELELKQVATLSANSDEEIGKIVGDAIIASGENGCIEVEDSKTTETYIEAIKGYRIDKGYLHVCFITNLAKLTAEYDSPAILVVDGKILNLQAMCELLDVFHQQGKPVVLLAEQFDDLVKNVLIANRKGQMLRVIPVQVSSFQKKNLQDIAIMTGSKLISEEAGMDIENWRPEYLGTCQKVKCTKDSITFFGAPESQKEAILQQIETLKEEIKNEEENDDNTYEIQKMKKRLGYLADGVHIIRVGGMNETEVQEKKDRIDDALSASISAKEEGIVPGGGTIYLRIISEGVLDNIPTPNKDQARGIEILKRALTSPTAKILSNAGERTEWVLGELLEGTHSKEFGVGYNAQTGEFQDMIKNGIIDPAKVSRICLESSSKSACDLLTTEIVIIDKPEEKKPKPVQVPMM